MWLEVRADFFCITGRYYAAEDRRKLAVTGEGPPAPALRLTQKFPCLDDVFASVDSFGPRAYNFEG